MRTGLNFTIIKFLINKYGSDVKITPVVKTISNMEGDETLTLGTPYNTRIYISRRSTDWNLDESGLIKGGDAIALVNPNVNLEKDYLVTWNNSVYRVQMIINRDQGGGTVMYRTANLFLVNDE